MPGEESCRGEGSSRCQEGAMLVRDMSREEVRMRQFESKHEHHCGYLRSVVS